MPDRTVLYVSAWQETHFLACCSYIRHVKMVMKDDHLTPPPKFNIHIHPTISDFDAQYNSKIETDSLNSYTTSSSYHCVVCSVGIKSWRNLIPPLSG
jgi:hypothetical protein